MHSRYSFKNIFSPCGEEGLVSTGSSLGAGSFKARERPSLSTRKRFPYIFIYFHYLELLHVCIVSLNLVLLFSKHLINNHILFKG